MAAPQKPLPPVPPSAVPPHANGAAENQEADALVAGLQSGVFSAVLAGAAVVLCIGLIGLTCFVRERARRIARSRADKETASVDSATPAVRHTSVAASFGRLPSVRSARGALKATHEATPRMRSSHLHAPGRKSTMVALEKMDSVSASSAAVPPPPTDDIAAAHSSNTTYC